MPNYVCNQVTPLLNKMSVRREIFLKQVWITLFLLKDFFKFAGKWLCSFIPVKYTPFWNTLSLHNGGCKFVLHLVLMLWFSWFVVNKSLFFTTKSSVESIYWDFRGKISNLLNNCLQESLLFDLIIIRIIRFWILKI